MEISTAFTGGSPTVSHLLSTISPTAQLLRRSRIGEIWCFLSPLRRLLETSPSHPLRRLWEVICSEFPRSIVPTHPTPTDRSFAPLNDDGRSRSVPRGEEVVLTSFRPVEKYCLNGVSRCTVFVLRFSGEPNALSNWFWDHGGRRMV